MTLETLLARGVVRKLTDHAPHAGKTRDAKAAGFPFGLGSIGVHEVAETHYGDLTAATGFVLAALNAGEHDRPSASPTLWISQHAARRDHGRLLHNGAGEINANALPVLHVTVGKTSDALWAVEEALSSGAVGRVVAELDDADFTATRRLALTAGRHGVPAILIMPHGREGASAAAVRWRIAAAPSAPNRLDPRAPGNPRWRVRLERCREAPHLAGDEFDLEFCHETLCLRVVPRLAPGTIAPDAARPGQTPGPVRQPATGRHSFARTG